MTLNDVVSCNCCRILHLLTMQVGRDRISNIRRTFDFLNSKAHNRQLSNRKLMFEREVVVQRKGHRVKECFKKNK